MKRVVSAEDCCWRMASDFGDVLIPSYPLSSSSGRLGAAPIAASINGEKFAEGRAVAVAGHIKLVVKRLIPDGHQPVARNIEDQDMSIRAVVCVEGEEDHQPDVLQLTVA